MNKEKKRSRKWIILIALLLLSAALCLWQKNNILALYLYVTYDQQQVADLIVEKQEKLQENIGQYQVALPRDLTEEEVKMLETGELTVEEATKLLLSKESEQKDHVPPEKSETSSTEAGGTESPGKTEDASAEIIRRYVAHIYSLKAYYMGQLNQIEARARSEYGAMTAKEKKNLSKAAFLGKYISYANSLMSECDGKMTSLLSEMKSELRAVGGDLSVITTIKQSYESEKAAQKAYYMSLVG